MGGRGLEREDRASMSTQPSSRGDRWNQGTDETVRERWRSGNKRLWQSNWLRGPAPPSRPRARIPALFPAPLPSSSEVVAVLTWSRGDAHYQDSGLSGPETLRPWALSLWIWWCTLQWPLRKKPSCHSTVPSSLLWDSSASTATSGPELSACD